MIIYDKKGKEHKVDHAIDAIDAINRLGFTKEKAVKKVTKKITKKEVKETRKTIKMKKEI